MDEGEADKAFGMASDQLGEFCIGFRIVVMEERKHDGFTNACRLRAPEIGSKRGIRIPGCRHRIPFACMAMKVNDHKNASAFLSGLSQFRVAGECRRPCALASASRNQMLVSMPLKKLGI